MLSIWYSFHRRRGAIWYGIRDDRKRKHPDMTRQKRHVRFDATRESDFIREQRERAAALVAERERRIEALRTRLRLLDADLHRAFGSLVAIRFLAIRQKRRSSVARMMNTRAPVSRDRHAYLPMGDRDGVRTAQTGTGSWNDAFPSIGERLERMQRALERASNRVLENSSYKTTHIAGSSAARGLHHEYRGTGPSESEQDAPLEARRG
jgi:hypothetical protein